MLPNIRLANKFNARAKSDFIHCHPLYLKLSNAMKGYWKWPWSMRMSPGDRRVSVLTIACNNNAKRSMYVHCEGSCHFNYQKQNAISSKATVLITAKYWGSAQPIFTENWVNIEMGACLSGQIGKNRGGGQSRALKAGWTESKRAHWFSHDIAAGTATKWIFSTDALEAVGRRHST